MDNLFDVVVQGRAIDGQDVAVVKGKLSKIFKTSSPEKIGRLLSNKPVTVKKNLNREKARKIKNIIRRTGAECKVVKQRLKIENALDEERNDRFGSDLKSPYSTPSANLFETKKGANALSEFKRVSTWKVFFLSLITFGIYIYYWIYSRTKILNKLPSVEPIGNVFMNSVIVFLILSCILGWFTKVNTDSSLLALSQVVSFAASALAIIWCFKFKNRLNTFISNNIGNGSMLTPIMTFFFQVLYLSYKLNENIDAIGKYKI